MRLIAVSSLRAFWEKHPDTEQPLKAWHAEVLKADWRQPTDVKAQFGSASILKNNRVVFNIRGGHYRLIASISYKHLLVYVKFLGTHKDYDAVDAQTVEMT